MTDKRYKEWVRIHVFHHIIVVGDFLKPSDNNCEIKFCTCIVAKNYRFELEHENEVVE